MTFAQATRRLVRPTTLVFAGLAAATLIAGCKQIVMLGYIVAGPPSIEPEFDASTGESMTDYGVTVAVVCYAPDELKWDFHDIDEELAKYVSYRLVEHHVQVVDPAVIADYLDKHDDWDSPAELGAEFETDYVIYIDLVKYTLYEENSQDLFRGRSEALVSTYKMDEFGDGEEIFQKDVISKYPTRIPRSASDISYQSFKAEYLSRLSEQIGRLFYEHYVSDDIGAAS